MIRFFCDRCGQEIDKDSSFASPFSDIKDHVSNTYYAETISFAKPRVDDHIYCDLNVILCEDCHRRIDSMINKFIKDGQQS